MHGHPQAVTALLSVTEWTVDQVLDVSGHAPVHWACMVGSRSCLKAIARFSPEAADALFLATGTGQTLLHLAVAEGSLEVVEACHAAAQHILLDIYVYYRSSAM
eukprot:m.223749 g.223749  ORF g.223749 m.223749 type:complete len:104 (+) comp17273_c0_seq15:287-598(+)